MGIAGFFTEMSWLVILLLGISLLFGVAEALTPGFGLCGFISGFTSTAALILEGIFTKSIYAVLFMFLIILILVFILFMIFVHSARKGRLRKTPIIESRSAIPEDYANKEEKKLKLGKVGEIVSECKPVGKVAFDSDIITVISKNGNLPKGKLVVVDEVRDNFIYIKELKGDKNE